MFHNKPIKISSGLKHSVCIDEYDDIWSFGDNEYKATGHNDTKNVCPPKQIKSLENIKDICCGFRHSICCDFNGNVYTFGGNLYGQIGNGKSSSNFSIPYKVNLPPVSQVSCGRYFSVCLTYKKQLYSFGDGNQGELGLSNIQINQGRIQTTPKRIQNLRDVELVECGGYFVMCVTSSGNIYSWGQGSTGQLALGNTTCYNTPQKCTNIPDNIVSIKCGMEHSIFLLNNGSIYSCGSNKLGQLGIPNINKYITSPQLIPNIPEIILIECGFEHNMFIDIDNNVWVSGFNSFGQLGVGDAENRNSPIKLSQIENVIDLSHGGDCTFIKTSNNIIYAMGYNNKSQLGVLSTKTKEPLPIQVFSDNPEIWNTNINKSRAKSARK